MLLLLSFYWFVVVSGYFVVDIIVLCVGFYVSFFFPVQQGNFKYHDH